MFMMSSMSSGSLCNITDPNTVKISLQKPDCPEMYGVRIKTQMELVLKPSSQHSKSRLQNYFLSYVVYTFCLVVQEKYLIIFFVFTIKYIPSYPTIKCHSAVHRVANQSTGFPKVTMSKKNSSVQSP